MPVHMIQLRDMGLVQGQNWHLDDLAADCAADGQYDFLLVAPPLPLTGAVGAPGRARSRSSSAARRSAAGSGCTSTIGTHMCAGAVTTVTTARATSSGCIVLKWRWMPKRCQRGMSSSKIVEVPVVGEAGERRADPHDRRADRRRPRTRARASARTPRARPCVDTVGREARTLVHASRRTR